MDAVCTQLVEIHTTTQDAETKTKLESLMESLGCTIDPPVTTQDSGGAGGVDPDKDK